jgi:hypothetical protein
MTNPDPATHPDAEVSEQVHDSNGFVATPIYDWLAAVFPQWYADNVEGPTPVGAQDAPVDPVTAGNTPEESA